MSMTTVDINLTARDQQVSEPWIWRLCREFNVKVSITKANVDTDFGTMQIRLEGPVEDIQRATAWLMTTGMHVDTLQRSAGVS
ncbi:MAG: NIL domain-containing protein [Fimbriimonadaceae bacterium]|nr:NIL domain-containing protein [Armatimonadota bacterium]